MSKELEELPNGTLILYRKKPYFVSEGVDDRVVTRKDGCWFFLRDLNWKTINIVYLPD